MMTRNLEWLEEPLSGGWSQWALETLVGRLVVEEWVRGTGQFPVRPKVKDPTAEIAWTVTRVPGPRQGGPHLLFDTKEEAMRYAEVLLSSRLKQVCAQLHDGGVEDQDD